MESSGILGLAKRSEWTWSMPISMDSQRPPFGSHPVPDLPNIRKRLMQARRQMALARAAGAPLAETEVPSLSSDRINYLVDEAPFYEINNAPPNQPIQWIITR